MASAEEHRLKPRSTIREVASAAGVSIATVSRVLNDHANIDEDLIRAGVVGQFGAVDLKKIVIHR